MNEPIKISDRLKALTKKTEELTIRHHGELRLKDKEIQNLKDSLRLQELALKKSNCKIEKEKTLKKSAEISLSNYKRKAYYFANKLIKLRR
jgi:hypothetical protein